MDSEIDIRSLAAHLKAKRGSRGLRAVAEEIGGVSASTLSRVEQGKLPDLDTFIRLCRWLEMSPEQFMKRAKPQNREESTPDILAAHLRADRTLEPETAEALATMIRLAYEAQVRGDLKKKPK